jgi:hypothetical protein
MRSRTVAAVIVAVFSGAVGAPQEAGVRITSASLLANSGFEEVDAATGFARGWAGFCTRDWGDCAGQAVMTDEQPHTGQRAVEISQVAVRYAVAPERLRVERDQAYLLRGWIRTDLRGSECAYLAASWFSDDGWLSLEQSVELRGVRPWQQVELILRPETRDEAAALLQVSCRVESGTGRGRAWLDDIELFECEPPPPEPLADAERRRYRNLARELLIQQAVWRERTETLETRRVDLERLLEEAGTPFAVLVERHQDAVRRRQFLFREGRSFAEVEAEVLAGGADVERRLDELHEQPDPRHVAFAELEALAALKDRVAADRDLRRFYLWAQLAALRGAPIDSRGEPLAAHVEASRMEALRDLWQWGRDQDQADLLDPVVQPSLDIATGTGSVSIEAEVYVERPCQLVASLHNVAGAVKALEAVAVPAQAGEPANLRVEVASPRYWYPDCPYTYDLLLTLWDGDEVQDVWQSKIAFREVRCVETDVTATMRHAWQLPLTDYSFTINGQPFFPTGTLCGAVRDEYAEDIADLFDELWTDFQRTYGFNTGVLDGELGRLFDQRGLCFLASLAPSYGSVRSYATCAQGFDDYRRRLGAARGSMHHPSVLTVQTGNEAELSVWGADLPSYYGSELWHCFDEVTRCLRGEIGPAVPVMYVRAGRYHRVAPVPREDLSGVNEYTGRYWGRVADTPANLAALAHVAALEAKPFAITEWNGPKYSWASGGVGGVTEIGAADYIYRYWEAMLRTPLVALSSEFTLNWVVTPIEDLTSVSVEEGLERRSRFQWSKQKGCDWYPHIWPDALTDTPSRRAMQGFQSPIYFLRNTPGEVVVAHVPRQNTHAGELVSVLTQLGKDARAEELSEAFDLAALDANVLLLGGLGAEQPECVRQLERMAVLGVTDSTFPAAGRFLIQERVSPHFPDRYLVVVTAADAAGMQAAVGKLTQSAEGLAEAAAREASCRRAIALIDDNSTAQRVFSRYVLELPTRGVFVGGDDTRTSLSADEFFDAAGDRRARHADLAAIILAQSRPLSEAEFATVRKLADEGVNIIASLAAYETDETLRQLLGVQVGADHDLTEDIPTAEWIQQPLDAPQIGDIRAEAIRTFGQVERGSDAWRKACTMHELSGDGWQPAASVADGPPVVLRKGRWWLFGADIAAVAGLHWTVTHAGVIHSTYDRDTACGLERLARLVVNACAYGLEPRAADTPKLQCTVETGKEALDFGDDLDVKVNLADLDGQPVPGAHVGISLAYEGAQAGPPALARDRGDGTYEASVSLSRDGSDEGDVALPPAPLPTRYAGQRFLQVLVEARKPGFVPDSTAKVVRVGGESDWGERVASLKHLIANDLVRYNHFKEDRERFVELDLRLLAPAEAEVGQEVRFEITVLRVEREDGDDWVEDLALVLRPVDGGAEVVLPVEPGKILASRRAPVVTREPDAAMVVGDGSPAELAASWRPTEPGEYEMLLRYLYSDQYRIATTDRLPCEDRLRGTVRIIAP